jgi:cytochrome c-type biogenesis protein CcmF
LFNNLLFLVACIAVLSGTLFPVFSEWFTGSRISVGAPFFNKVNIPLGLIILLLTGVGPLLAWRKTSTESLKRNFLWPTVLGLVAGAAGLAFGFREIFSLICLALCAFVAPRSRRSSTGRQGGAYSHRRKLAHFLCRFDAAQYPALRRLHRAFRDGDDLHRAGRPGLQQGSRKRDARRLDRKSRQIRTPLAEHGSEAEKNYVADRMILEVLKDSKPVMMLYPERRNFPTNQESGTMVAIYSTLREDLYVVYAGINPANNLPTIHAFINPLVKWVWWGGMVLVMGTIVALLPNRAAVVVLAKAEAPADARELSGMRPAQVALREGHD